MASQDDSSQSSKEDSECPMCLEELDLTDLNFKPCSCGYQMCRFCWHRINSDLDGKCPHCRKPYDPDDYTFTPPDPEELEKMKKEKKQKEKNKKNSTNSRKHLTNVRVIQRNLVYVTNIPLNVAKEDFLKKHFTQYGKIIKVVVNRHVYNSDSPSGPSVSCYITYYSKDDAFRAIQAVNGATLWGKQLRASFGTTKYCTYFLKFSPCPNPECMYLHELGGDKDSFTKEEMNMGKHLNAEAMQILNLKNSQSNGTNSSNSLKSSTGSLTKTSDTIVDKSAIQSTQAPIGTPFNRLSEPKGWNITNNVVKTKRELDNNEWPTAQSTMEVVKTSVSTSQEKTSALPSTASWGKPPNAWTSKKLNSNEISTKPDSKSIESKTPLKHLEYITPTPSSSSSPSFLRTSQEIVKTKNKTPNSKSTRTEYSGQHYSNNDELEEISNYSLTDEQFQFQQEEEEEEERDRQYQQQQWANNQMSNTSNNNYSIDSSQNVFNSWKNGSSLVASSIQQPNVNAVNNTYPNHNTSSSYTDPELSADLESENWNESALGIVELLLNDKLDDQQSLELLNNSTISNTMNNNWNPNQQKQRPAQSRFNFAQETESQDQSNHFEDSFYTNSSARRSNEVFNTYQPFRTDSSFGLGMDSFQQPVDWFKSFLPHVNVSIGNPTNGSINNTNNINSNQPINSNNNLIINDDTHSISLEESFLSSHSGVRYQHPVVGPQQLQQPQHQQQMHSIQNGEGSMYQRQIPFPNHFQQQTLFNNNLGASPFSPYTFSSNNPSFQQNFVDPAILGTGTIYVNPWGVPTNQANNQNQTNNPYQNPNAMYNMNGYSFYGNAFVNPPFASHPTAQHSVINSESSSVRFSRSQS